MRSASLGKLQQAVVRNVPLTCCFKQVPFCFPALHTQSGCCDMQLTIARHTLPSKGLDEGHDVEGCSNHLQMHYTELGIVTLAVS